MGDAVARGMLTVRFVLARVVRALLLHAVFSGDDGCVNNGTLGLREDAYKCRFFPSQCRLPSAESVMTFLVEEGTSPRPPLPVGECPCILRTP